MAENFKLPGSSYDEFTKIISAYASGKPGQPMSLDTVAQSACMDKTIVSRNNGFLIQCGLITEGNQKSATEIGNSLGKAYQLQMDDEIKRIWHDLIESNEFLSRMLSAIRIRKTMEKSAFLSHIIYSAGGSTGKNAKTGSTTLIELMKVAGFVNEQDGQIIATETAPDKLEEVSNPAAVISISKQEHNQSDSNSCMHNREIININININVTPDDIDTLPKKLQTLLDSLENRR